MEAPPPGAEPCRRAGPDHLPAGAAEQRVEHHQLHARAAADRADHLCRVHRHGFPAGRAGPHHRRGPQLFCQRLFSGRQPDAGDADLFQRPAGGLFLRLPGRKPQRRGQWHHLQALRWRHRGPHGGADSPAAPGAVYPAGHQRAQPGRGLFQLSHLLPAHAGYDLPGPAQHADLRAVHHACPARGAQQPSRPVQRAAVRDQQ